MAHLLQTAEERNLRHVFVVLPYTNIIRQAVKVYREALCLPGEDPESVVAAHHHLAEFQKMESRHLTALWRAPVIVTTAVQFFETLGAAGTARLRKLHELPGSAVFVDEAHAAMPVQLWPFMWNQMDELAEQWGCRFVLGSGSLAKFWEEKRLVKHLAKTPNVGVLAPAVLRTEGDVAEASRVEYRSREDAFALKSLADWIESEMGPRIVVMNTVQSAAVVARELRQRGSEVIHLSTALAPVDRKAIVERILAKLWEEPNGSWTLVATSCVEAGLDFDFAIGFRERARAASLAQLAGRVNRHGNRGRCVVWDFTTNDPLLSQHPGFGATRAVVRALFQDGLWNATGATELMTEALYRELVEASVEMEIEEIRKVDKALSYCELAKLTRLIQADTRLVVVDGKLTQLLSSRGKVGWKTLLQGSVQLWSKKIDKLRLEPIPGLPDVYRWGYEYDPNFLGIMQGALRLIEGDRDGYLLI
jgi:CRISPR-associated endonuclease/helicase Cas3